MPEKSHQDCRHCWSNDSRCLDSWQSRQFTGNHHHTERQAGLAAAKRQLDPESIFPAFWLPPLHRGKAMRSSMRHLRMVFFRPPSLSRLLAGGSCNSTGRVAYWPSEGGCALLGAQASHPPPTTYLPDPRTPPSLPLTRLLGSPFRFL